MSDRKRSLIWLHFTQVPGTNKAKCDICSQTYSYTGGSTSNLAMHLKAKHPSIDTKSLRSAATAHHTNAQISNKEVINDNNNFEVSETVARAGSSSAVNDDRQIDAASSTCNNNKLKTAAAMKVSLKQQTTMSTFIARPTSVTRQKLLNRLLLEMIVKDLQPFSIVEDEGFRRFVAGLDPSYVIPSRKMISTNLLPTSYYQAVDELKSLLCDTQAVCLTTDSWTSGCTENYIAVTAHFISTDFKLRSCLLECFGYTDSHTSEHLRDELIRVTNEWGIFNKIVCVVTDNAANITKAVQLAKFRHLGCFAHTLNLVVQKAVPVIEPLKAKVKKIVEHFRRSTTAAEKLKSFQLQMKPDRQPLKLKNDVVTRWNSTYVMFQRICDVQEPLEAAIAVLHNPVEPLTADEWSALKEITVILKPFNTVTTEISSEATVSVSKVILLSRGLMLACRSVQNKLLNSMGKDLMTKLCDELQKRFGTAESVSLFARATFLDPRFKKGGFVTEACYIKVVNDMTGMVQSRITETQEQQQRAQSSTSSQTSTVAEGDDESCDLIWGHYELAIADTIKNPQASAMSLIRQYLEESYVPRRDDPLAWWRSRDSIYKELASFAKSHLCIVATSVPSERVFSKSGQLISDRRSRLSAKNVQMVMFLNQNYKLLEEFNKV